MKPNPIVSIVMATYNRAHFIVETLQSIQNQSYMSWECLIVDDGGTDNTPEILQPVICKDNRFKYSKRPEKYGKGLPGCRNYGVDISKGKYIIFFDDDDIVHPQNLKLCVSELTDSKYDFCRYERAVFIKEFNYSYDTNNNFKKFQISINDLDKMIDGRLPFNSCAVMWKKESFTKNRFVESLMFAEEWELYARLLSQNIKGVSIEKTLFYGRKHENSNTGEFWLGDSIRVNSKKQAIELMVKNLVEKSLLTPYLLKYLTGLAISFRDKKLLNKLLNIAQPVFLKKEFILLKYYMFPIWKIYKRNFKKLKSC